MKEYINKLDEKCYQHIGHAPSPSSARIDHLEYWKQLLIFHFSRLLHMKTRLFVNVQRLT